MSTYFVIGLVFSVPTFFVTWIGMIRHLDVMKDEWYDLAMCLLCGVLSALLVFVGWPLVIPAAGLLFISSEWVARK